MATATCITSNGVRSAAAPFKTSSAACITRSGAVSAASRMPWAGKAEAKTDVPFLPPIHVSPVLPDGRGGWRWNPDVYRSLQWLYDKFVGGPNGKTVPEVLAELAKTQGQVTATSRQVVAAIDYAAAVDTRVTVVAQVAQSNDLSGAEAIPEAPEPPNRYADRYVL